jgi:hypothetical protein
LNHLRARHRQPVSRLNLQRLVTELVERRDNGIEWLLRDLVNDQVIVRVEDRRGHGVVDLDRRVTEKERKEHLHARLVMELIEQINGHIERVAHAAVAFEVIQIMEQTKGQFLRRHRE